MIDKERKLMVNKLYQSERGVIMTGLFLGLLVCLLGIGCIASILEKYLYFDVKQDMGEIIRQIEEDNDISLHVEAGYRYMYDNRHDIVHINKLKYQVPNLLHEIGHAVTVKKKWMGRFTHKFLLPLTVANRLFFYPYYAVLLVIRFIDYRTKWCYVLYDNPFDRALFILFLITVAGKLVWLIYNEVSASLFAVRNLKKMGACDRYVIGYFVSAAVQQVTLAVFLTVFIVMIRSGIIEKLQEIR